MGSLWLRFAVERLLLTGLAVLIFCGATIQAAQQESEPAKTPGSPDPVLSNRPASRPKNPLIPEGKIKLDVVVSDATGRPAPGLEPWDFKILDNNVPRKVLSFRAFDGMQVKPDPPVEVLLVLDVMNLPFEQVAFVRGQIDEFLRQNNGQLKQPLTLMLLTDEGMRVQPRPSTDGNAIATVVDGVKGAVRVFNPAMGGDGYVERFQRSARAIDSIAENEAKKPGRKLLIWVGPGWPMLNRPSDGYTETQQKRNFHSIVEISTALREARVTVYSVAPAGAPGANSQLYQDFVAGVKTYRDAVAANLGLKVLVVQTGGRIFGPTNDLVSQINDCIADANAFYRISFDPPKAEHMDEYHDVKVMVDRAGLFVRTNTGYYNEPAGN
jgi:VWFA-related protein